MKCLTYTLVFVFVLVLGICLSHDEADIAYMSFSKTTTDNT